MPRQRTTAATRRRRRTTTFVVRKDGEWASSNTRNSTTPKTSTTPLVWLGGRLTRLLFILAVAVASFNNATAAPTTADLKEPTTILRRVATLSYEKSGSIHSLSWSSQSHLLQQQQQQPDDDEGTNAITSTTTNNTAATSEQQQDQQSVSMRSTHQLAAASMSVIQVWNQSVLSTAATNTSASGSILATSSWMLQEIVQSTSTGSTGNNTSNTTPSSFASKHPIRAIAHCALGNRAASGGDDSVVRIWRTDSMPWQEISSIAVTKRMGPGNLSPAINASSGSSTPTTNTTVPPPSSSSMPQIRSLAWHPTGRYLAASGLNFNDDNNNSNNNGTLVEAGAVVWNSITWERVSFRLDPTESENRSTISSSSLDWSPDGKHLVVSQRMFTFLNDATAADNDATTTLTESATLETCSQCRLPKWSPDGRYIATAFGNQVYILNGAQALAVQQNKNTSNNKSVVLMAQGASLYNVTTVPTYMMIGAMAWSPNSNYLAVGGAGNAYVYLWDTSNWDAMPTTVETTDGYGIDSLSWSPGGHSFAVGTGRVIEIWHMEANTTPEAIPSYAPVPNTPWETFTPTSSPILGIIESTVVPSSSSSAESTTSQAFSVATMTGIAVIAIVISVASAVVLFGWRLRVVVQNDHGNSKAKHRKKRHGEVPSHKIGMVTFSDSEDKTGDTVDEEHLDRVISFSYLSPINGS